MSHAFLDKGIPVENGKSKEAAKSVKEFMRYCRELQKSPSELTKQELDAFRNKE